MLLSLPDHVEYVRRVWSADPGELRSIRRAMREWLAPLALDDDELADMVLAVDEAVANAIEHGYPRGADGMIELVLWTEPNELCVELIDHGRWRGPARERAIRGRGIQLMRALVDSLEIRHDALGTRVLLRHSMPSHGLPPPERHGASRAPDQVQQARLPATSQPTGPRHQVRRTSVISRLLARTGQ